MTRDPNYWLFNSVPDGGSWAGNDGYRDDPTQYYEYNSFVSNFKNVETGDIVLIRSGDSILGTAVIREIESRPGTRTRYSCPDCNSTKIQERATLLPPWRCAKCKLEFENPDQEVEKCTEFRAIYGGTFRRANISFPLPPSVFAGNGIQQSMRRLISSEVERYLNYPGVPFSRDSGTTGTDQVSEHEVSTVNNRLYYRVQGAINELKSAISDLLSDHPEGLTNAEIGRSLGISFGHARHEGHISGSLLSVMEIEGTVVQDGRRGPWMVKRSP